MKQSMQVAGQPSKISYEEFLEWCDEDTLAEWTTNEIIMTSPASLRHQTVADFLLFLLRAYVEKHSLGQVVSAPFQMKVGPGLGGREPDLLFVSQDHLGKFKKTYLDGPADLVIEIVSPESRLRDRGEKLAEYEMGGVREYWVIDPEKRRADFHVLAPDGCYERKKPNNQNIYRAETVPGFWLKDVWLWQEPLPPVLDVLHELRII